MTAPAPSPRAYLSASIEKRTGSRFLVNVEGNLLIEATTKPQAISALCREAIARGEAFTVSVREGMSKSFLSVTAAGRVTESSPPAPTTTRPDLSGLARRDLGLSPESESHTEAWVSDTILGPGHGPATPATNRASRWGRRPA